MERRRALLADMHVHEATVNSIEGERHGCVVPIVIKPAPGWASLRLKDLWEYRELLYFLTLRDFRVRYAQTALGVLWAVIRPVSILVVFSTFFGAFAHIPSDGLPYPLFAYSAILLWQLFAQTLTGASNSLVANQNLITKVYFPRLIIPLSVAVASIFDFLIASAVLVGMMGYYHVLPTSHVLLLPLFVLLALVTAMGVGLWLSALNVRYRDVGYGLPFALQVWLFATPVIYPVSLIPESWRFWIGLNPMASVVEGVRWVVLGTHHDHLAIMMELSVAVATALFVSGLYYFRRVEQTFADVM
jgi:homopolymeric O-antigen transport system permease protein